MSCFACGKDWTGFKRCHCATCHENFSSLGSFDKHRKDFKCRKPADCGLILVDGYWQGPQNPYWARTMSRKGPQAA